MPTDGDAIEHAVGDLCGAPIELIEAAGVLPAVAGVYAWWASPDVFPELPGPANPAEPGVRLLYVGIATRLRARIMSNHMARSGSSTLRRTLAGLLMDEEGYRTTWTTDRVVLVPDDERRLTIWMHQHISVTWTVHSAPRTLERQLIERLRPPFNVEGAEVSAARETIQKARAAYRVSAGPRPPQPPQPPGEPEPPTAP